ncbi:hypothetical protein EMIT036CA2_30552 [Chryseobacterium sp. IT-36CA2]
MCLIFLFYYKFLVSIFFLPNYVCKKRIVFLIKHFYMRLSLYKENLYSFNKKIFKTV